MGAVSATEELLIALDPMTDDSASAVQTSGGEGLDSALKAVKRIPLAFHDNIKGFVVGVVADGADSHTNSLKLGANHSTLNPWRGRYNRCYGQPR